MKNEYFKRQLDIMSSLGLFYLIILALFSVPIMGALVVVVIKGVIDYQYVIIIAGCILFGTILFAIVKFIVRMKSSLGRDGRMANRYAQEKNRRGGPVSISAFNGLFTVTYGGGPPNSEPEYLPDTSRPKMLPAAQENQIRGNDIVSKLQTLSDLKKEGVIDEAEFLYLKQTLIDTMNSQD